MTIYRGTFLDTPDDDGYPGTRLRVGADHGVRVVEGVITHRGAFTALAAQHPTDDVVDLSDGLVLPGLVDTHVHYPQVRAIGSLGLPLLQWLEQVALPEEARLVDQAYATTVAAEFVNGLVSAGTTTALVFGSHFTHAVDALFTEARRVGLRITSGLVVSDRSLPPSLLTTPERSYQEAVALAARWHGVGRARYAVTPRFSYSASDELLDSCRAVLKDVPGTRFTSHVNENPAEIAAVSELFPTAHDYVDTYDRHGLLGGTAVLAHNVHPTERELKLLGAAATSVSHCPTSNSALGSGLFPLAQHLAHGIHVALGSDVSAGAGFSLFKEGLQAYFMQQLLGPQGVRLTAPDLLHLATRAGAIALGLADDVGDLSIGKQFDAIWVHPRDGDPLEVAIAHARSPEDALAKTFTLATPADVAGVWVGGDRVKSAPGAA